MTIDYLLNKVLNVLKTLLLLVSLGLTLYVILFMYKRLDKSLVESVSVFLPYLVILILFMVNFIYRQKIVNDNFFYNIVCCLVFSLFIYCGIRAIADPFMISGIKQGFNINFDYYSDMIAPLQIMLYGLSAANIFLLLSKKKENSKLSEGVAQKIDVGSQKN